MWQHSYWLQAQRETPPPPAASDTAFVAHCLAELLVVIGRVREDGQKVLLAVRDMGGETTEAWRTVLDDLIARVCAGRSS